MRKLRHESTKQQFEVLVIILAELFQKQVSRDLKQLDLVPGIVLKRFKIAEIHQVLNDLIKNTQKCPHQLFIITKKLK
jgi:hypothetical protein